MFLKKKNSHTFMGIGAAQVRQVHECVKRRQGGHRRGRVFNVRKKAVNPISGKCRKGRGHQIGSTRRDNINYGCD